MNLFNKVTKDRILLCEIWMFWDYDAKHGILSEVELPDQERLRVVIFMDGEIIDLNTREIIKHIKQDKNGLIISEIDVNTMYVKQLYKANNVSKDIYNYAQEVYQDYLKRKKLINEGKLILFKQKRLY